MSARELLIVDRDPWRLDSYFTAGAETPPVKIHLVGSYVSGQDLIVDGQLTDRESGDGLGGWKVCLIQFVKSERWKVGEREVAMRLGVEWWTLGDGFTWDSRDRIGARLSRARLGGSRGKRSSRATTAWSCWTRSPIR